MIQDRNKCVKAATVLYFVVIFIKCLMLNLTSQIHKQWTNKTQTHFKHSKSYAPLSQERLTPFIFNMYNYVPEKFSITHTFFLGYQIKT